MPGVVKDAVVDAAAGSPNVTAPGPLTLLQRSVNESPSGSLAVPAMLAVPGMPRLWSLPALTTGAWSACTEMDASAVVVWRPSDAVTRITDGPSALNVTVVAAAFGFENVALPGPL